MSDNGINLQIGVDDGGSMKRVEGDASVLGSTLKTVATNWGGIAQQISKSASAASSAIGELKSMMTALGVGADGSLSTLKNLNQAASDLKKGMPAAIEEGIAAAAHLKREIGLAESAVKSLTSAQENLRKENAKLLSERKAALDERATAILWLEKVEIESMKRLQAARAKSASYQTASGRQANQGLVQTEGIDAALASLELERKQAEREALLTRIAANSTTPLMSYAEKTKRDAAGAEAALEAQNDIYRKQEAVDTFASRLFKNRDASLETHHEQELRRQKEAEARQQRTVELYSKEEQLQAIRARLLDREGRMSAQAVTQSKYNTQTVGLDTNYSAAMAVMRDHYEGGLPTLDSVAESARIQQNLPGAVSGAYSIASGSRKGSVVTNFKGMAEDAKAANHQLREMHSLARGVASGFGAMWLTWGSIVPLLAGAAISNGLVQVAKQGAEAADTLLRLKALTGESAESMAMLNAQMLELSRSGAFAPKDIAEAMKTLALAGNNASEVFASIRDVLNFSMSGDVGIKEAADTLTSVASAFGYGADGFGMIADTISKAAAISKSSVEDFSSAMKTASVVNSQFGVSLKDVEIGVALLANVGVRGQAAGTALRNMYTDLAGRTKAVRKELAELGVNALDANGKVRETSEVMRELAGALGRLNPQDAEAKILGIFTERSSKAAVEWFKALRKEVETSGKAVNDVYGQMGEKLDEAAGMSAIAAAEIAQSPLNQMKATSTALQSTLVESFDAMRPYITSVAVELRKAFASDEFKSSLQALITGVGELTKFLVEHGGAVVNLVLAYAGTRGLISVVGQISIAMSGLGAAAAAAGTSITGLGVATKLATLSNPLLLGLSAAFTAVAAGVLLWKTNMGEASKEVPTLETSMEGLLESLEKERKKLEDVNIARGRKISLIELERERALEAARVAEKSKTIPLRAEIARLEGLKAAGGLILGGDAWKVEKLPAMRAELQMMESNLKALEDKVNIEKELIQAYSRANAAAAESTRKPPLVIGDPEASRLKEAGKKARLTEAERELAAATKYVNDLRDKGNEFLPTYTENLAKLDLAYVMTNMSLEEYIKLQGQLNAEQPVFKDAQEALRKVQESALRVQEKDLDAMVRATEAAESKALALEDEVKAYGLTEEALRELTIARLEDNKASLENSSSFADLQRIEQINKQISAIRRSAQAKDRLDTLKAQDKESEKAFDDISKSLADSLMRGFEDGKGFFDSFIDGIKNTLKTTVLRMPIQATVQGVVGSALGVAGSAANAVPAGTGSPLGVAGTLSNLYNMATVGTNASLLGGVQLAQLAGQLGNTMVAEFAGGMMSTTSTAAFSAAAEAGGATFAGALAGSALNGFAGYGISKTLSGGYSLGGVNEIAGLASMLPGVGPIAGVIGGLVNRAFGMGATELTAQGTRGTFGPSGFSGKNYATYHQDGGWFRGDNDWTVTTALTAAVQRTWSATFSNLKTSVAASAAALALSTDAVTNYSKAVDIAAGSTEEQIAAVFKNMADEMATAMLPGITDLAKVGESASDTLSRLSSSLTTVNQWFDAFGRSLYDIGAAGADAASTLADTFGGLDNLNASSQAFYEAYYTDAERMAQSQKYITKALQLVNQTLPASKAAFRDVVTGLDLTTESGRSAYAVMLSLAPEFANLQDALTSSAQTLQDVINRLRGDQSSTASTASLSAQFNANYVAAMAGNADAVKALANDLPNLVTALKDSSSSREEWLIATGRVYAQSQAAVNHLTGVPGFASGGVFGGGLRLVGEGGPELELTGPSRIFDAETTDRLLNGGGRHSNAELEAIVQRLLAAVEALGYETRSVAEHTSATFGLLRRVTPGGDAIATRAIA